MTRYLTAASLVVALTAVACLGVTASAEDAQQAAQQLTLDDVRGDIELLERLNRLALDTETMERLLAIAVEVGARRDAIRQLEDSDEVLSVALKIRQAMLEGQQGEALAALHASMAVFSREHERRERDLTRTLSKAVEQAVGLLDDEQAKTIVATAMGNPVGRLLQGMRQARGQPEDRFDQWLARTSREMAISLAMGNEEAAGQAQAQIEELFQRVREMNDEDFEAQGELLQQEARMIVESARAEPDPQWVQRRVREALAQFLMHPRLPEVLKAKIAFIKGAGQQ